MSPSLRFYAVQTIAVSEIPDVVLTWIPHTHHFRPSSVRKQIVEWFEHFHPAPNLNRGRLSGTASSLTSSSTNGKRVGSQLCDQANT